MADVDFLFAVVSVGAGIGIGAWAGYALGTRAQGSRGGFWSAAVGATIVSMLIDFAGLMLGQYWLAVGAIGLMCGALTGLKYGYSPNVRVWEALKQARTAEEARKNATGAEQGEEASEESSGRAADE